MRIAISSGHGKYVRGASASPRPPYLDERDEAVRVVNKVYDNLLAAGVPAYKFHDEVSKSQNENLNRIVDWHNAQSRDLDVSVHFNAGGSNNLMGTEVLYITQNALAGEVSAALAASASWPNRGPKKRTDLFFLNNTAAPAILIETCFVDSSADGTRYRERFDAICRAITDTIGQIDTPPGPEPEPEPEPEQASVTITTTGNVRVTINGQEIQTGGGGVTPAIPSYQRDIIATEFYGTGAPGAYGIPIPGASSSAKYLALPWRGTAKSKIRVYNRATGQSAIGELWDLGPWCIADNYQQKQTRPIAETCYKNHQPLPADPAVPAHNVGKIPNGAGIDLSPALARAIGINGKGPVDWEDVAT